MSEEQADVKGEAQASFFAKQQLVNAARAAFHQLSALMKNATLYPPAHPFLLSAAEQLLLKLEELFAAHKEAGFYMVGGELFFETLSVPVDQNLAVLMEEFAARDVGGVVFRPPLSRSEIVNFAYLMQKDKAYFASQGGVAGVLRKQDIFHIELHRVLPVNRDAGADRKKTDRKKPSEIAMDAIETVRDFVHTVHLGKTAHMRRMNAVVHAMVDGIIENRDAFLGLTTIKLYDEYTFAHSVNTAILAIAQGAYLSFDKPQIAALGIAGMLHDIGKVSIPIEIINKPDKLTDQEWDIIKRHPIEGALILSDIPGITKLAMVAAFEHHQHGDLRGYPRIGETPQQHPFSQIVAVADAYDALIASRVYYSVTTPPDQAIRVLLQKRGTAFDPVIVKAFVNMIGIFPAGTILKLDTGESGLVVHQTRDLVRPRVLLLDRFDGSEKTDGLEVSLLETEGGRYKRTAVATVDPAAAKIDVKRYFD